jgi:hypothetical protein
MSTFTSSQTQPSGLGKFTSDESILTLWDATTVASSPQLIQAIALSYCELVFTPPQNAAPDPTANLSFIASAYL